MPATNKIKLSEVNSLLLDIGRAAAFELCASRSCLSRLWSSSSIRSGAGRCVSHEGSEAVLAANHINSTFENFFINTG